jgi:4-amino-4-deoxy-L-arabinose transferase-like glycosyltransferase
VDVLALGLLVRIAWIALAPNEPTSDQYIYHTTALYLAEGKGYVDESGNPANFWPVGYSALLAPFYFALGAKPIAAFVANLLLGLSTVAGVYLLAKDLFNDGVARVAALVTAVYPTFVFYTTCFASENAYVPGMVFTVWLGVRATRGRYGLVAAAAAGVALGATGYVRATVVLLFPVLFLWFWLEQRSVRAAAARGAVVVALSAIVLLPWSLRNHELYDSFTPFSMNGGSNLWMGNHPGSDGAYHHLPNDVAHLSVLERDKELGRRAREFVKAQPLHYLKQCVVRLIRTLSSDTSAVVWNERGIEKRLGLGFVTPLKWLTTLSHYAVLALSVVYVVGRVRRKTWSRQDTVIACSIVALSVPFVFIVSGNRYHLPLIPFLLVWVGVYLVERLGVARTQA